MLSGFREVKKVLKLAVNRSVGTRTPVVETCTPVVGTSTPVGSRRLKVNTYHAYRDIGIIEIKSQLPIDQEESNPSHNGKVSNKAQHSCTPVNRLPSEILADILLCDARSYGPTPYSVIHRAVLLSGVCSYWRRVITSTSSFWSRIPLDHSQRTEDIVSLCLKHSQGGPINISAESFSYSSLRGRSALIHHYQQIRSLSLYTEFLSHVYLVMRCVLISGVPSRLEELSVSLLTYERPLPPTYLLPNFLHEDLWARLRALVKGLRILNLDSIGLNWLQFSFDKLQRLRLSKGSMFSHDAPPLDQLAHIVANSPNLRILEIEELRLQGARKNSQPISMGSLETLRIGFLGHDALRDLLRSISPGSYSIQIRIALHSFVASADYRSKESIERGVAQIVPLFRQFPNITTLGFDLDFDKLKWIPLWLPRTLQVLPNLQSIYLDGLAGQPLTYKILSILTRPPNEEPVGSTNRSFPGFRTIRVSDAIIKAPEAFKTMITSHPIERVELIGCWIMPSEHNDDEDSSDTVDEDTDQASNQGVDESGDPDSGSDSDSDNDEVLNLDVAGSGSSCSKRSVPDLFPVCGSPLHHWLSKNVPNFYHES
ncbi:hypothetical protein CTheo_6556 [Ceratobasidium theobromae]|uniref:Uncharacterized protein n=1 Tax=Ceratobasidium theobromae TaxID=1582974 RepID=A0A5N5QFC6_9AGAM|nr:hypothetical protein CTheo_6556 [Ceratobasidium theobromae]